MFSGSRRTILEYPFILIGMETLLSYLTQMPVWLEQFDKLAIPTWAAFAALLLAGVSLVFAGREFSAWFFKTNAILDELTRVEGQISDLEGDLKALTQAVRRLEATASPNGKVTAALAAGALATVASSSGASATGSATASTTAKAEKRPLFPLSH